MTRQISGYGWAQVIPGFTVINFKTHLNANPTPILGNPLDAVIYESHELFMVLLVTCYSEGEQLMHTTVESLVDTNFSDDKKLLFIVTDGIITGSGNNMLTPDICLSMLMVDPAFDDPKPQSYISVAAGYKRHNCSKVYLGHFIYKDHQGPILIIFKCGNAAEEGKPKVGNCSKCDSQLILMNFFSCVLYNEMLMVDADKKSMFGGVMCLLSCFCMYLLKDPKGDVEWVPIITKPEIIQ
ncbi:hypothetical protein L0F63_001637 [Massospora cicadina]|nr:hypothetical protein L0F63_001637 [Massospora cicadina]